ncbi:hypothetical protein Tco_0704273 [Tanacetum coccineum]|uniref:Uncharacterized protein n=1 Tax=Tanacetum coccineum TaxID=301880 RepID=A0ABQ4Y227_9ASTR
MQTKIELTLEQTQQGVSNEVLIDIMDPVMQCTPSPATQEHQSDTKVFTMMMEILPELTSNKLCGSDEVLKLKNFKKDKNTSIQEQEKYEHVDLKVTSTQDGKRSHDDEKRLYLTDDLKEAQVHMQVQLKGKSSSLKSKDRYAYQKIKDKIQDYEQRPKTFVECKD